jgi:hypothetical protein
MTITHNLNDSDPLYLHSQPTLSSSHTGKIPGLTQPSVTVHCRTSGDTVTHPYTHATSAIWGKITSAYGSGYVADVYLDSRNNTAVWECT